MFHYPCNYVFYSTVFRVVKHSNSASLSLTRLLTAILMLGNEVRSDKLLYLCTFSYLYILKCIHTKVQCVYIYVHICMNLKCYAVLSSIVTTIQGIICFYAFHIFECKKKYKK